jgi:ribosomal protein S18 acetylase RimI-like enzyme
MLHNVTLNMEVPVTILSAIENSHMSARAAEKRAMPQAAGALLARAFAKDPLMYFVLPEQKNRHKGLVSVFTGAARACHLNGGIATINGAKGMIAAALWLPLDRIPVSFGTLLHSGMIWTPLATGLGPMVRLQRHEHPCEQLMKDRSPQNSGYLWCVGVEPDAMGQGAGKAVIAKACTEMRAMGLSHCVLKTENPANVALYEHLGFAILDTINNPEAKLTSWMMSKPLGFPDSKLL